MQVSLKAPPVVPRLSREAVGSLLARLIASGTATTKADLGRATGLARTTVDAGVANLFEAGAIRLAGFRPTSGRGRAAEVLELDPGFGIVLVADCGASVARLAAFDLGQRRLGGTELAVRIQSGPTEVLDAIGASLRQLAAVAPRAPRVAVMGLPGPVHYRTGSLVRPPIMPGWDGFEVVAELERSLRASAVLENDVNLRALGEARASAGFEGPLLYLKVGTGIGVGIVGADGELFRGADGAAGDVGHLRLPGATIACACGGIGCLETVASASAIGRDLGLVAHADATVESQLLGLVQRQDAAAAGLVRERADVLGDLVVSLIHCFNPRRVVVGGRLALASDALLAGIRSAVYRRALPLATRDLTISLPTLGNDSGVAGALAIGIEAALSPAALATR